MALSSGQRLLHFTLVEKIGQGGMGEVWRALDTTLDRQVAIKVLPAELTQDPERVARLEREAKLLASLNHPNIAAIYGFPEAELPGPAGTTERMRFLAMELVRGEDFAEIVARGPLPVRAALDAARQIAAALDAAHEAGVIHRDLKPANVKRTPDGEIKVLDFGLAKAAEPTAAMANASQLAHSPTMTIGATVQGVILGTASYMSPEQARGFAVDRRTDLWAFGCVLYELLTGRKAFDGTTVTDVLAAVIQNEPDWESLPPSTPAAVRRLLRRCLEKNPKKRLRDAGDLSLLLDENPEDSRAIAPSTAAPPIVEPRSRLGAALLGALVALSVAAGAWLLLRGHPPESPTAATFQRLTFARGMMRAARFAPDGRTVVYGASWDGPPVRVYLGRTDSPEMAPLPLPPGELLSVSKSGEVAVALGLSYYGYMGDGTLARTTLLGGEPREVLEHVRSADWSADGAQFAISRAVVGGDQLESPPGTVLDRTAGYFADVRVSPDGELVAYTDHPNWGDNRGGVAIVDRKGKKTTLASGFGAVQGLAWSPSGREVWYTVVQEDGASRLLASDLAGGSRVVLANLDPIELFDIAADGRVLLGRQRGQREVLALLDGYAEPRLLSVAGESSLARGISRDGRAVLVTSHLSDEYQAFWIRSDRPGAVLLGAGDGIAISPDGLRALIDSSDYRALSVVPLGAGSARTVPNPDQILYGGLPSWHPDGREVVVPGQRKGEPARAWRIDLETGKGEAFGPPGAGWTTFTPPPLSSDGKLVVLLDVDGTPRLWPLDGGEPRPIPGARTEDQILNFTEDDAALLVSGRSVPVVIERLELATGKRSHWLTVSPSDRAGLRYEIATITPDGKHWALSTAKLFSDLFVVEGLK